MKKNTDLTHLGERYYNISYDSLTKAAQADYDKEDFEEACYSVSYEEIEDFSNINYDTDYCFDEELYYEGVEDLFKEYPHYLRITYKETWNNASGYTIDHNKEKLLYLGYEHSTYFQAQSKHRKSTYLRISSHDSPTGFNYLVIGLTETEYELLNDKCIDDIFKWAEKHKKILIKEEV